VDCVLLWNVGQNECGLRCELNAETLLLTCNVTQVGDVGKDYPDVMQRPIGRLYKDLQMKFFKLSYLTAAGAAIAMSFSSPALADFWWDTSEGQLYFDGASGDFGVFRFLDGQGGLEESVAIYIKGVGSQYTDDLPGVKPGTYEAQWFNYEGTDCSRDAVDPDGNIANEWGVMWFTVEQNNDYFTAQVYDCEEQTPSDEFKGTPGT